MSVEMTMINYTGAVSWDFWASGATEQYKTKLANVATWMMEGGAEPIMEGVKAVSDIVAVAWEVSDMEEKWVGDWPPNEMPHERPHERHNCGSVALTWYGWPG